MEALDRTLWKTTLGKKACRKKDDVTNAVSTHLRKSGYILILENYITQFSFIVTLS